VSRSSPDGDTFSAVPDVLEEKRLFLEFLVKHLRLQVGDDEWASLRTLIRFAVRWESRQEDN
jgi:hypothetical protein